MGATILLVGDEKRFIGRLRSLLGSNGSSVLSASSAAQATSILSDFFERIQLVIVCLGVPDGTDSVVRAIARRKSSRKPRVIATGDELDSETYRHADRTVVIPGTDQDWLDAISVLLDRRSITREAESAT